jgi:hypothetical protein
MKDLRMKKVQQNRLGVMVLVLILESASVQSKDLVQVLVYLSRR